jgi:arsenate reductase
MLIIYGIPNCDTIKKTLSCLEENKIKYEFVNFKKEPPTISLLKSWKEQLGELPVNKKGATFRKIKDEFESADEKTQIKLLIDNTSAIKRPIIEEEGAVQGIGFDEETFLEFFT